MGYKRLGEILVDKGYVSEGNLAKALALQQSTRTRLGDIVSSMGWATELQVTQCLAEQYGYEVVDLNEIDCDQDSLELLNNQRALCNLVLPIRIEDGQLHCVVGDPINVVPIDELRSAQKLPLKIFMAPPSKLREAIIQQYFKADTVPIKSKIKRRFKIDDQNGKVALLKALEYESGMDHDRIKRAN